MELDEKVAILLKDSAMATLDVSRLEDFSVYNTQASLRQQRSTATHIVTHTHCAARSNDRNTQIRPEGVAWAALSFYDHSCGGNGGVVYYKVYTAWLHRRMWDSPNATETTLR